MLWCSGGFTLRVLGSRSGPTASVSRPFGVIGRAPGGALVLDDPAVSSRHVYLHLDQRGLFAVDLATRTGTRIGTGGGPSGWLAPGDRIELAGRTIEVVEIRLDNDQDTPPGSLQENPLDDAGSAFLARLTLFPESNPEEPLALNSELVFAGRSPSCAVPVSSDSAMRVQCVFVRAPTAVYVVDLVGRGTWRNNRPVIGAARLLDGDSLMIGAARFNCRISPAGTSHRAGPPMLSLGVGSTATSIPTLPALFTPTPDSFPSPISDSLVPPADVLNLIPVEAQAQVLGWLMSQVQSRQDESSRRQSEFQTELVRLVAEIHRDNQSVLQRHLERAEAIHEELAEIRDEMKQRFGDEAVKQFPALAAPKPPPLRIAPVAPPENPEAAANWLINRVNQLDQESRSTWKDLIGRLAGRKEG
jgi:pSer/pThr/pTyr-binding forkhead associated (FHA) protein